MKSEELRLGFAQRVGKHHVELHVVAVQSEVAADEAHPFVEAIVGGNGAVFVRQCRSFRTGGCLFHPSDRHGTTQISGLNKGVLK